MNLKMIFSTVGKVVLIEAVLLILPIITALIYCEWFVALSFGITLLIALAVYGLSKLFFSPETPVIFSKEGLIIVALAWLTLSLIGCLPFVISGDIPSFIDALFETVSGFTTTGASILTNVEGLSRGCLFWRSFSHWIGGMGILVFVMAVSSKNNDRSIHILRAEMPGPTVDKLVPRAKDTAKILYFIYVVLTVALIVMLLFGGMPLFDSILHAFGTAGTGGFGLKNDSLASYNDYCQWVIAIFMIIFGVNFNLYYLVILGKVGNAFKSEELWLYVAIVVVAAGVITANLMITLNQSFGLALKDSVFQVASIMSTTGFSTVDFDLWPTLSKSILLILMFIGGCAGSTAGGFKVSRVLLLGKNINREFKRVLHPRNTSVVKTDGKRVSETTLSGLMSYLAVYLFCIVIIFLLISFEPFGIETNFTAVVSCFNNIGPGLASVGPACNYAQYSVFSKIILTLSMLLGRLEIYPILLTLMPTTWIKR